MIDSLTFLSLYGVNNGFIRELTIKIFCMIIGEVESSHASYKWKRAHGIFPYTLDNVYRKKNIVFLWSCECADIFSTLFLDI